MTKEVFNNIFDSLIVPFIKEVDTNHSRIRTKDLSECKNKIYKRYIQLNNSYKENLFGGDMQKKLLDRHKVASCICGAFLEISIFDKTELIEQIKKDKTAVEWYFYYVNEFVAFYAGCKFLSFYMVGDMKGNKKSEDTIIRQFPSMPPVIKNNGGSSLCSLLFNLSQIKDEKQIGQNHYDKYAYAMIFFLLEHYFYKDKEIPVAS